MEVEYLVNVTALVCFIMPLTKESPEECGTRIASIKANYAMYIYCCQAYSLWAWVLGVSDISLHAVICKRNLYYIFRGRNVFWLAACSTAVIVLQCFFLACCLTCTSRVNRWPLSPLRLSCPLSHSRSVHTCIHKWINAFIVCSVSYSRGFWHKLFPKPWVMHCSHNMFFFCFPFLSRFFLSLLHQLSPHPQSSHWVGSSAVRQLLVCSAL